MNSKIKVLLVTVVGIASLSQVKAGETGWSYGDLIVGFTTQTGNDHLQDLGSSSTLTNGQSWNLSTLLSGVSLTAVNWGVVGDASAGESSFLTNVSSVYDTIFATSILAPPVATETTWGDFNTGVGSITSSFPTYSSGGPNAGDTLAIAATDDDSWNGQTISGTKPVQIVNAYGNPNAVGLTNISLWQVTANSSAPVLLGKFSLSSAGLLTFSTTVTTTNTPPAASFTGAPVLGFAPVTVVFTDASTGTITNQVWNFGNGRSVTNTAALGATNTYASAGSYTVTETLAGPGGANSSSRVNYVVVSAAPKFGSPVLSGTNLVFSGSNGPAGVPYRIFTTTNLALPFASWKPVLTNTVSSSGIYSFTNATTQPAAFFQLFSP